MHSSVILFSSGYVEMVGKLMRLILNCLLFFCFLTDGSVSGFQTESILKNGSFERWTDGQPDDWNVDVGAGRSNGKKSKIASLDGVGVSLSGDRSTRRWQFLSQELELKAGRTYRLSFSAAAEDVRLEANQFNNCYVGVFKKNRSGKIVGQDFKTVSSNNFQQHSLIFEGVKNTSTSVWIFLSKTGNLSVKDMQVVEVDPNASFDILVEDMAKNYSYFEHKKIDWKKLTDQYRGRAESATDKKVFVDVVLEMLGQLKDGHVWILENGKRLRAKTRQKRPVANYNIGYVRKQLRDERLINKYCLTGRTAEGFGYVLIDSLYQMDDSTFQRMCNDIHRLLDAPGLIVDCRTNGGGAEPIAQKIAGMFVDKRLVYAKQKFRSGPGHSDFTEPGMRSFGPWRFKKEDKAFLKPIVCLQGPGAVSSGEGFVMMMKAIPHCTTIGQPTAGSSGNPAPVKLPNGVEVWYSRWVSMDADGNIIEDVGVKPDQVIEHTGKGDLTFSKAVELLRAKTK